MDRRATGIIALLAAAVVILAVALVIVIASGGGDDNGMHAATGGNDSYMGMMRAMGGMDSDAMLAHMRDVLGEDGYRRMLQHFRDHRSTGPMTGDAAVDEMMHRMMDGMMGQMAPGDGDVLPRPDERHATPTLTPQR